MRQIGCPETSETDYNSTTRKTQEESRLQLHTFSYETREYKSGAEPLYNTHQVRKISNTHQVRKISIAQSSFNSTVTVETASFFQNILFIGCFEMAYYGRLTY
jgi:hypothetical protein